MSIQITAENICKQFDNGRITVIPDLSITINKGEFFTLLGPSGCGKTTFLRMIAGFNSLEAGKIYFDDMVINDVPVQERNIGMVFQNYAIFPHLTVYENVAFGLKQRNIEKDKIKGMVDEVLKSVRMDGYEDRLPEKLSGGQQQRVALARAIVIHPSVLLMDEPLSNLDAKLRVEMRSAIRELQKEVGITTVYVTHDQEEALAISDRIAIMNFGEIQQLDSPLNIYTRPANTFVATFIGFSNLFNAKIKKMGDEMKVVVNEDCVLSVPNLVDDLVDGQDIIISMRPDEFNVVEKGLRAKVVTRAFLGHTISYKVEFQNVSMVDIGDQNELTESMKHVTSTFDVGSEFCIEPLVDKINVFTADGKRSLIKGVLQYES